MEIGDKVTHYAEGTGKKQTGTIIWIHPEQRFYRVLFENDNGSSFVEAFQIAKYSFIPNLNKRAGFRKLKGRG